MTRECLTGLSNKGQAQELFDSLEVLKQVRWHTSDPSVWQVMQEDLSVKTDWAAQPDSLKNKTQTNQTHHTQKGTLKF